jgi:hypothetical protein
VDEMEYTHWLSTKDQTHHEPPPQEEEQVAKHKAIVVSIANMKVQQCIDEANAADAPAL